MKKGFYSANVRKPAGRIPAEPVPLPEVQTKEVAKPTRRGWRELYKRHEKSSILVAGASLVRVQFEDGLESEAAIISTQPENDLAVLQAKQIPDDLQAATLRSAKHLIEGEHVTAIGFPFGIGPSVSHGVISGLKREYQSPDGERVLSNLIQFDAAANPGSSGGPLVNAAGEVIGIVTAILSTAEKAGFSGIAFAVPIELAAGAAGPAPRLPGPPPGATP